LSDEPLTISLEQVFGMIFKYVKQLSEKHGKTKVRDCVIVMPNYWTLNQRIVILNALAIADLYPLSILSENTAAAIQYAMNRQDNTTHRVLFYNLGANALQVSIAEFKVTNDSKSKSPVESVHIIDEFGINRVGGLEIDVLLAEHFQKIFYSKHKK
jgi:hypoxia up-regulated 1